ncbi:terminase small subunit [Alkalibacillus salilacus]|uniref:Phage terminase small subunit n=1 Tax=Alkalibacillus salilacus TaxID=284582 RepID=A0ABT9VCX3_9BACI|nr:terminase small subunit [Alkalibacillus salilacus]MDQ0158817.1 phage terminase small subunit [Alkalibacillus salilacus]
MAKLTEKQRRFADEYIRLGEITQAAINAGYSTKTARVTGQENMTKPAVKTYIDERLEQLKKESIAEQDEVLQYLTSVMRGEVKDEVAMVVGDGDFGGSIEKEEKRSDTVARTKAAELLGKRYGMWTEKHQVENITPVFVEDVPEDDD